MSYWFEDSAPPSAPEPKPQQESFSYDHAIAGDFAETIAAVENGEIQPTTTESTAQALAEIDLGERFPPDDPTEDTDESDEFWDLAEIVGQAETGNFVPPRKTQEQLAVELNELIDPPDPDDPYDEGGDESLAWAGNGNPIIPAPPGPG